MSIRMQLPSGVRWSGTMAAALLAGCAGAWVIVAHGVPVLVDLFRPSVQVEAVDVTTPLLAQHEETHGLYGRRLEGRSLFFAPSDWKRKPPPPPPPPPPAPPPPPPAPPVDYAGPRPIGLLGSTVFLEGGRSVQVGTESEGVLVEEVVSPWELRIRNKGKTYSVPFGQRPNEALFTPLSSASTPSGITVAPAAARPEGPTGRVPTLSASPAVQAIPLPPARSQGAVSAMDVEAARSALAEVSAARGRSDLDPAVRQRLELEERWLTERLEALTR